MMNGQRNGPMSPVSVGDSEWSGISKYQNLDADPANNPNNRGQLISPPMSTGSNSMAMNNGGYPPRGSSGNNNPGGPSPPASIARSSTGLYAQSESGRSRKDEQFEAALSEHYTALKRYLAASLRDEKGNPRPNRARDKLLRLSPVQFQELSTDVFDELLRRQAASRRPPPGVPEGPPPPEYLLPKDSFHPKRNQARQKLSTLPPPRFRDLATDVFYELERRFPRFSGGDISRMGSPASSVRGPSRNGTPVNGMGPGGSRIRRPSEATSISGFSVRSDSRNGSRAPQSNPGGIPPSPGPVGDFGRPQPKTFQSNTMVPNKSTMVEDDETGGEDDDDDGDAFGLESAARSRESKKSGTSDTDKKLIDDYQSQVAELREKLDAMEDNLKQKDDELNSVLDGERSRATAANVEKKEWGDLRRDLESKLIDAQKLNDSLQSELDRLRSSQANNERDLQRQIQELRAAESSRGFGGDARLEQENEELRNELREQQRITDEVRKDTQQSLREMRMLSEQSPISFAREEQLMSTVSKLEDEVKDWRNRYARTKTQLRNLRASSIGLTIQQDAAKYAKESGFTKENGLVKDVHVTKFQISIDELLQVARNENPERAMDFMKAVVVNVRNIVQDIDEAGGQPDPQQAKLKSRVSATTNNLITASKNHASAKGLAPVSLLDAAASHLTTAIVELVKTVKIRPTPAGELEDDDDGNITPMDNTSYFPVRDLRPDSSNPPAFRGLGNARLSTESSMYSNSPRVSMDIRARDSGKESWGGGRLRSQSRGGVNGMNGMNGVNGVNGVNGTKALPLAPMGVGFGIRTQESDVEDLKIYLDDQTALLVSTIQSLVSSIRSESGINTITTSISAIASILSSITNATETAMSTTGNAVLRTQAEPIIRKLSSCRLRLVDAGVIGTDIAAEGRDDDEGERIWRQWCNGIPPMAFEVARETKELVVRVDNIYERRGGVGDDGDDFS